MNNTERLDKGVLRVFHEHEPSSLLLFLLYLQQRFLPLLTLNAYSILQNPPHLRGMR